jgi:Carboxypeptidase regulatory-like domain
MERLQVSWAALLLVFMLAYAGVAWTQVSTGTISGTVTDSSGAALPGVSVVVLDQDTGISRTVETDSQGHYSAVSLSLGHYRVTGTRDGFKTAVREGIQLTVGREEVVNLSLTVGTVTQTVTVTGGAPLVEATTASLGSLVDDQTIREFPLNGRSYDQLALIQPGVNLTSPGGQAGIGFTFGTGARFSVGGQLPNSNLFLLDGTDINDQANGTPGGASGTNLDADTILEFKIFTNLYNAEFGHSTGSVITSVTRSGTNSYHGTVSRYTCGSTPRSGPRHSTSSTIRILVSSGGGSVSGFGRCKSNRRNHHVHDDELATNSVWTESEFLKLMARRRADVLARTHG